MDPFSDIIALLRPHAAFSKPITGRGAGAFATRPMGCRDSPSCSRATAGSLSRAREPAASRARRLRAAAIDSRPLHMLSRSGRRLRSWPAVAKRGSARRPGRRARFPHAWRHASGSSPSMRRCCWRCCPGMIHIRAAEGDTGRLARIIDLDHGRMRRRRAGSGHDPGTASRGHAGRVPALAQHRRAMPCRRACWPECAIRPSPGSCAPCMPSVGAALDRGRLGEARRHVALGLCRPLCRDARLRADGVSFALAHGLGPGCLEPRRESRSTASPRRSATNSASAFSTAFRRRVGCSPGAFARSRASLPETRN